jgi:transcriptional repressor NrdR
MAGRAMWRYQRLVCGEIFTEAKGRGRLEQHPSQDNPFFACYGSGQLGIPLGPAEQTAGKAGRDEQGTGKPHRMQCPYCRSRDSRVVDSRTGDSDIRRRRECESCGARFTTYERVEHSGVRVVKKDGRREPFAREKLAAGLQRACEKRPLATEAIDALVDEIERRVRGLGQPEVASALIGELVMDELRGLDQIAYVRFASVYRSFTDVESLRRAIDELDGKIAVTP